MTFADLHMRLAGHLRARVRAGEFSERGLARVLGLSQPYLHQVLAGTRGLSTERADQVLQSLRLGVADLLGGSSEDATPLLRRLRQDLGPGHPFPAERYAEGKTAVAGGRAALWLRPALVRLSPDPALPEPFAAGALCVLDRAEWRRRALSPSSWYAVDTGREGLVRRVRLEEGRLTVFGASHGPFSIAAAGRNILEIVRAQVVWLGRDLD